jgi:UDP-3-O-[3-hydroxymyristoyl] N-acetylglucosamine deacetylase
VDGAAQAFLDAIVALEIPPSATRLVVAREGAVDCGSSSYAFSRSDRVELAVEIDFGDRRLAPTAAWDGSLRAFRRDIAAARTFALADEVEGLADRGLVAHVAKESVVVLAKDAILSAGAPFTSDEPARHKLLDLAGDLYVWGGPPRGRVLASRPGHAATHDVMKRALAAGIVEFTRV